MINLLDNQTTQPSKCRIKNWVEANDDSRKTYSTNNQINFKTLMLKSSLWDYSDAYILVKRRITVLITAAEGAAANNAGKKLILKNCAPFTDSISKVNNTQVDHAKDIDKIMLKYNYV